VPGFPTLLGWRRSFGKRRARRSGPATRKATLVPPGLSRPELAMVAGSVLFHFRQAEPEDMPPQLRAIVAALLWGAARLVVMGERGAGAPTRHDLDRCAEAVYRHLGLHGSLSHALGPQIDQQLQDFFGGPDRPLALLVERLAPSLAPVSRAQVAAALEELIRDLAEQFGMTRAINMQE
jgi:hypothetical protein